MLVFSFIKFICAYYSSVDKLAISLTTFVIASSKLPALNSSYFFVLMSLGVSFGLLSYPDISLSR